MFPLILLRHRHAKLDHQIILFFFFKEKTFHLLIMRDFEKFLLLRKVIISPKYILKIIRKEYLIQNKKNHNKQKSFKYKLIKIFAGVNLSISQT